MKLEPRSIAIMWRRLMPQARAGVARDKPAALRARRIVIPTAESSFCILRIRRAIAQRGPRATKTHMGDLRAISQDFCGG